MNLFHDFLFQNISRRQLTHHVLVAQLNVCPKFYQFDGKTDFDSTEVSRPPPTPIATTQLQSEFIFVTLSGNVTQASEIDKLRFCILSCLISKYRHRHDDVLVSFLAEFCVLFVYVRARDDFISGSEVSC